MTPHLQTHWHEGCGRRKESGKKGCTTGGGYRKVVSWGSGRFPLEQEGEGMLEEKFESTGGFAEGKR